MNATNRNKNAPQNHKDHKGHEESLAGRGEKPAACEVTKIFATGTQRHREFKGDLRVSVSLWRIFVPYFPPENDVPRPIGPEWRAVTLRISGIPFA